MWCDTCQIFEPYSDDEALCVVCGASLRFAADDLLGDSPRKIVREIRPPQVRMAEAVEHAIQTKEDLVAEAGTGVGKSFAVLIPAILSGKRTVISTATTLLQHQYVAHVLPYLAEHMGDLGFDLRYAVCKGKRHYLCPKQFNRAVKSGRFPKPKNERDREVHEKFLEWCEQTETGDRQELDVYLRENITDFNAVAPWYFSKVTAEECTGAKTCKRQSRCGYVRARMALLDANIVIANHTLVALNLKLGWRLLPQHSVYIMDEAHKAADYFRNALSAEVSERSIEFLQSFLQDRDIVVEDDKFDDMFRDLHYYNTALFQKVKQIASASASYVDKVVIADSNTIANEVGDICRALEELVRPMARLYKRLTEEDSSILKDLGIEREAVIACADAAERYGTDEESNDDTVEIEAGLLMLGISRIERLRQKFHELLDQSGNTVLYVERSPKNKGGGGYKLTHAPVSVGAILRDSLYPMLETVVQTSATLSIAGDFSFYKEEMGLASDTKDYKALSPFDYRTRALLYMPRHLPAHPGGNIRSPQLSDEQRDALDNYFDTMAKEIARLVKISKGCAFVLCSARAEMEELYDRTQQYINYPCRIQDVNTSTGSLQAWFCEENNPVLFATKSFWEGISIEGKQLRMVIIPKVPFPVPTDPIMRAKEAAIKNSNGGGSPFMRLSFPSMCMDVQQGFGRLIRTMDDFGVAALLDTRAVPYAPGAKRYANRLVNALPFVSQTNDIDLIRQAMDILEAKYGPF